MFAISDNGECFPEQPFKLNLVMQNQIKVVPIGTICYWRDKKGSPTIRKAKFMWMSVSGIGDCFSDVRFCWNIAGIGEVVEEASAPHHIGYVGDGFIYMSYDGADMMSDEDKLCSSVKPTDLISLFSEKYGHLKSSMGSFNTTFYAWRIDEKTNAPKEFYVDAFVDTIKGELVASIPAIDNGEAFATKEECLAHREKCQLVDFDDEEPTEEREPTKKELLDQWLDKQQMSLDELRDIIND